MAVMGYSLPAAGAATDATATVAKALVDKVQQLERRLNQFVDETLDYGDVNTDTELKETERTA